jgi:putative FmdB family regulatory protein
MPIYEYQCDRCQHNFEVMQKMSDPAPSECPHCKAKEVSKKMSMTSFALKGNGWYVTDFKDKSKSRSKAPAAGENAAASCAKPACQDTGTCAAPATTATTSDSK